MAPRALAWQDGRVLPATEATVPLLDAGFRDGDAVREDVMVVDGRTHALDAHLSELRRSAKVLGLRLPVVTTAIRDLLVTWGPHDGTLEIIVTRGGAVRTLVHPRPAREAISLACIERSWSSVTDGISTVSRADRALATRQANDEEDADDALVCQQGTVLGLPSAAIAFVHSGHVRTPDPTQLPIADAVTVRELAKLTPVEFGVWTVDDVLAADEILALSPSLGFAAVHAVDDTNYPAPGPVTLELRDAFWAHVAATLD